MSNCKVAGCTNVVLALGLCAKHYMRARRTGDPSIKLKPGPKPKPGGKVAALSALERELARLRAENAELRRRSQQGPKAKDELKPAGSRTERFNPRDELGIANAKIASMRGEIRELQAKLKVKVEMPKDVVALQQQLKAARTRVHNLTIEKNVAWRARVISLPLRASRTGRAYDSHHRTAGIAGRTRRRGGRRMAARGARAERL
jgi:hypothetical protein